MDTVTKFTLEVCNTVIRKSKLEKETRIFRWLAYDGNFLPGKEDIGFNNWTRKGIKAICKMVEKVDIQN